MNIIATAASAHTPLGTRGFAEAGSVTVADWVSVAGLIASWEASAAAASLGRRAGAARNEVAAARTAMTMKVGVIGQPQEIVRAPTIEARTPPSDQVAWKADMIGRW